MSAYHDRRASQAAFVIVSHEGNERGERVPIEIPGHLPCCLDGRPCRVSVHSLRERKTGPRHRLVVVRCATHRRHFTLYPPGHVPYGRAPVAAVDHAGRPLEATGAPRERWRGTFFRAAVEAASEERLWPRDPESGEPALRTQKRHAARAAAWLGLGAHERVAEAVAEHLDVGVLVHSDARAQFRRAATLRGRARAIVAVLDAVAVDGMLLTRLLRAGHATGCCPQPWWWTGGRGHRGSFRLWERAP